MHLCRGNFEGAWVAEGGYDPVAELVFGEIEVDGFFIEYDSTRAGGFAPLRFLPRAKSPCSASSRPRRQARETKEELKRRIDEASKHRRWSGWH